MPEQEKHRERYRVTHQESERRYDEHGQLRQHFRVHLEHPDGTKGYVELPDEQYTPENVHALAQDQTDRVMAVANLPDSVAHT